MWTRASLKARAWATLRTAYWKGFLASFILLIVSGGLPQFNFGSSGGGFNFNFDSSGSGDGFSSIDGAAWAGIIVVAIIAGLIALAAGLALRFFLLAPLEVGGRQYFKQAAQGDVDLSHLVYAFSGGRYLATVKGMAWRLLWTFLWFLAFIIPGIVKSYSYSMVPYILADDPHVGTKRALKISMELTRGHKWRMFVLDLSFIGWYLLGMIALFVGVLFVQPYVDATKAELYLELRSRYSGGGGTDQPHIPLQKD